MIKTILILSRSKFNVLPLFVRNSKLMEEVGKFSEGLMHKMGFLPHKRMAEPLISEAADIIICVLDTLSAAYPDMDPEELANMVGLQVEFKCSKWERIMKDRYDNARHE